jgi:hypothetical protein
MKTTLMLILAAVLAGCATESGTSQWERKLNAKQSSLDGSAREDYVAGKIDLATAMDQQKRQQHKSWDDEAKARRAKREANSAAYREADQEKRAAYVASHPDLPLAIKTAIQTQEPALGLTPDQMLLIWGQPDKVNQTVNASGIREQWVYSNSYIYFENGKLTTWQTSR